MTLQCDQPPRERDAVIKATTIATDDILVGFDTCLAGPFAEYKDNQALVNEHAEGRRHSTLHEILSSTMAPENFLVLLVLHERIFGARTLRLLAADMAEHVLHLYEQEFPFGFGPTWSIRAARRLARHDMEPEDARGFSALAMRAMTVAGKADDRRNPEEETLQGVIRRALRAARGEPRVETVAHGPMPGIILPLEDIVDTLVRRYNKRDKRRIAGVSTKRGSSVNEPRKRVTREDVRPEAKKMRREQKERRDAIQEKRIDFERGQNIERQAWAQEKQRIVDDRTARRNELVKNPDRYTKAGIAALVASLAASPEYPPYQLARSVSWLASDLLPGESRWHIRRIKEYLKAAGIEAREVR